jgi:inner membrane protein
LDNLTHSLVGLFLARAGLKNVTPRGTAIMVLAANAPDFDAVSWFGRGDTYIHWHRNITHSLIAIPFMALLSVAIVWLFDRLSGGRGVRWMAGTLIAIVAVGSHIVLDLTNVYGVRLLLPFSGQWFHWDITPIVDIALWAILILCFAGSWFARLVGSEIGERRRGPGPGWAIAALVLFTGWDTGREVLHNRAAAAMNSRTYRGEKPLRAGAFPGENPLVWDGIAELNDSYVSAPVDLRARFRGDELATYYKAARTPAVDAAMATELFQRFLEFVQYPIWVTDPAPDYEHATRVRLVDMRFGTPVSAGFQAVATVNDRNQVIHSVFTFGLPRPR